jgi:Rrf2 family protein
MKISSKGRYGLAAMIHIGAIGRNGEYITIISIAEALNISKIYLEQVFSLLRRANLVISVKGAQGGYRLSRSSEEISAREILEAIELSLFEPTDSTVKESNLPIEKSMENLLWRKLDNEVAITLASVSLKDLVDEAERNKDDDGIMFYI